jgi:hypothetical protein
LPHVLLNGAFRNVDAQLEEFAPDAFSSEDGDCPLPSPPIKATVSWDILGLVEVALDLYFQYN